MLKRLLIVFACFLGGSVSCQAGLGHDTQLTWMTAESPHFRIHFHDDEQALAQRALGVAEDAYHQLTPVFDWYPRQKTDIVLSDEADDSNGFATPFPSNRITLLATPPYIVNSLEDHDGWFETVILHELVHILHLDKAIGEPNNGRRWLGRFPLFFPHAFLPPWMHEGLATYYETDETLGIGRGQSSYFAMMMRMEVANGIKPLRQVNQPMVTWPLLTSRYLYGVYFFRFIAKKYGQSSVQALVKSYADHWIPYRINGLSMDVLGKDMATLWDEFEADLHQQFDAQIQSLRDSAREASALTHSGDFKRSLVSDGGAVYVVEDHLSTGAHVLKFQGVNTLPTQVAEVHGNARLAAHGSAGLLLSQPEVCRNANSFHDLYRINPTSGVQTRLTTCARYIAATFAADGWSIYALHNARGQHAIHQLSLSGELEQVLWAGDADTVVSDLDASADGKMLVAAVWRRGSGWNIEEFDVQQRTWLARTSDASIKTDAKYVGNSRDIVFSMDQGGVYNIHRLHQHNVEASPISSVVGGAFSPLIQGKQLWFIGYGSAGFDVFQSNITEQQAPASHASVHPQWVQRQPIASISMSAAVPYQPWDTLLPTSWFPSFYFTTAGGEFGINISGTDVLNRHQYQMYTGINTITASPVVSLQYIYDRYEPSLHFYAQQLQTPSLVNNHVVMTTQVQRLEADIVYPIVSTDQIVSLHAGVSHVRESLAWLSPAYISNISDYQDTLVGVAFMLDTSKQQPRSISPSQGQQWMVLAESGAGLGGQYAGSVLAASLKSYWDLGDEQVLAGQVYAGFGSSTTRPFQLGGQAQNNIISPVLLGAPYNRRSFALRGYADGQAALRGEDMLLTSLEYRFPIARIERGWMAPPIGVDKIFGQLFVDAAKLNTASLSSSIYSSVGAELGADLVLFYNLPVRLQLGYAQGLDDALGEDQWYLGLGSIF